MKQRIRNILLILLLLSVSIIFANGGEIKVEKTISSSPWQSLNLIDPLDVLIWASVISGIAIIFAVIRTDHLTNYHKKIIFTLIAAPIILATLYLAGTTVYLNIVSETGGPVHWHADIEIWNCNSRIEIADPSGLSNRIGAPTVHEHGDSRIHIEGVLLDKREASIHSFFEALGGTITKDKLAIPTEGGLFEVENGELCNSKPGEIQIFVYKIVDAFDTQNTGFEYEQSKVDSEYILSPFTNSPPGDCIIIEFDTEKEKTDKICETFKISIKNGDMKER